MIPGLRRSPGVENGNLLQYSCLKNLMDRCLVGYSPGITKSRTQLSDSTWHSHLLLSTPSTFSSSTLSPFTLGQYFHDLVQSMFPPTFCRVGIVALRRKAAFLRDQLIVLHLHSSARKLELTEAEWFSHRHQT